MVPAGLGHTKRIVDGGFMASHTIKGRCPCIQVGWLCLTPMYNDIQLKKKKSSWALFCPGLSSSKVWSLLSLNIL